MTFVIALDGPSGTGKSTVSRAVAEWLRGRYLDTGAMYRAATLAVLRAGVDPADPAGVARVVDQASIGVGTDPAHPGVTLDGGGVDAEIRTVAVTAAVSAVSAIPAVRERLVGAQREIITACLDAGVGVVAEGRDIATTVWPAARPKIFLTASAQARARRRAADLGAGTDTDALRQVAHELARRDGADASRATSPFTRADDAVELDTTDLDIADVVARVVALSTAARAHA